ncbi:MAG: carbohydrate ABC transporter permease [Pseudomonadota bacterium]
MNNQGITGVKLKTFKTLMYISLSLLAVATLFPLFWGILTSLKTEQQALSIPPIWILKEFHWENYTDAWNQIPFGRYYLNTTIMTVFTTLGSILTSAMAGYALAKFPFKGQKTILLIIIATMMIPYWVNLVPVFIILAKLKWLDTFWGLIIPQLASPFGIFMMRQYMVSLPIDYIHAGRIDGANEWQIFWKIVLPQCTPALATLAILFFVRSWNSLMWPLIVTSSLEMRTVTVGLAFLSGSPQRTQYALQMSAATLGMIPAIIVFLIFQKYLIRGISLSGIKG